VQVDADARRLQQTLLTTTEALEMAETMSNGEAAQMAIAAEIMGLDYDDFLERRGPPRPSRCAWAKDRASSCSPSRTASSSTSK
jgi:hypothetical protein